MIVFYNDQSADNQEVFCIKQHLYKRPQSKVTYLFKCNGGNNFVPTQSLRRAWGQSLS